jgi:CBS domain containing-hemolysin-like protein
LEPQLLAIALLVVLNGFFVASEFAIVKVRSSQLAALTVEGNRRAVDARHVTALLEAYLSVHPAGHHPHSNTAMRTPRCGPITGAIL